MELISIHPDNPQERMIKKALKHLVTESGIAIYPTDTVYGIGGCASHHKALNKISAFMKKDKARKFSFLCSSFAQASKYVKISDKNYKLMKHYLPGPYTFILPATKLVPKKICPKRQTVGIRIPDSNVCRALVEGAGEPIANTSLGIPSEHRGNPDEIIEKTWEDVDCIIECGPLDNPSGSTIVDLTKNRPEILRQGIGEFNEQL
ncbi:MAG: L-threonylcarbamoyladenylate synthase [Chitinivibrionales bacterium]